MTDHPITPPIELVQQWMTEARSQDYFCITEQVAHRAAQWGADQELEACCEWMSNRTVVCPSELRAARRPKPPTLAEQGMRILMENGTTLDGRMELDPEDVDTLHAVLLRLKQLEDSNG